MASWVAPAITAGASLIGGLLNRNGSTGETNQQSRLNDYTLPFYSDYLDSMWNFTHQPYQQYGGQRVAGADPYQQAAWDKVAGWANNPSAEFMDSANAYRSGLTGNDPRFSPTAAQAHVPVCPRAGL